MKSTTASTALQEPCALDRDHEALVALLRACRARAQEVGEQVLLRLHVPLGHQDPWQYLQAQDLQRDPFFAWHDAQRGLTIAALGEVWRLEQNGEDRFAAAQQHCSRVRALMIEAPVNGAELDAEAPCFVGGFAFWPRQRTTAGAWAGWPAGMLAVARVAVYRRALEGKKEATRAVVTVPVTGTTEAASMAPRVANLLAQLHRPQALVVESSVGDTAVVPDESFTQWRGRVERARSAVAEGLFEKVVLARSVGACLLGGKRWDPLATLRALRRRQPGTMVFAVGRGADGTFVGATPETLAEVQGRRIETHALAGTAPRDSQDDRDHALGAGLLNSQKDINEHSVVVRMLRETLAPACARLEIAPSLDLVRLADLQHLATRVRGELRRPHQLISVTGQLHPSPAVGGWPREKSLRWLDEQEAMERGWYAGPVGWTTCSGDGVFAVAIRSGLLRGANALAFAGSGIVSASEPRAEWHETDLKLRPVLESLAPESMQL